MHKKLLVVDDQIGMARVFGMIANDLGFETRTLTDPMLATDMFIEFKPDVLIVDMIMPEKDGIDILHEILLTGMPVKVVLTSGLSDGYLRLGEAVARFHAHDRVAVLRKPFRRDVLVKMLMEDAEA